MFNIVWYVFISCCIYTLQNLGSTFDLQPSLDWCSVKRFYTVILKSYVCSLSCILHGICNGNNIKVYGSTSCCIERR